LNLTLDVGFNKTTPRPYVDLYRVVCVCVLAGDTVLESVRRVTGTIVSSQVSFLLRPDDNGAEYQCNASNAATTEPLVAAVTLRVSCT